MCLQRVSTSHSAIKKISISLALENIEPSGWITLASVELVMVQLS